MGLPIRAAAVSLVLSLAACTPGADRAGPSPTATATQPGPTARPTRSPSPLPSKSLRPGPPKLELVARLDNPLHLTAPPGDASRLFVTEQAGRIMVVRNGRLNPQPFLDIRSLVRSGGERGLLSIVFSPDYATDRLFYVNYTDRNGDTRVVEYAASAADPDRADPASRRELLHVGQPYANHNGGLLLFDASGMLIVGLGDGGAGGDPANRAQKLGTLLGKLLRIDPRPSGGRPYGVPPDNPFVGRSGARPEIWAYGLRNPWRFSFDQATGNLYLGDVGQNRWEELNVVPPDRQSGANYGWRAFEGRQRFRDQDVDSARLVEPVLVYGHSGRRCSITGGFVYRGSVAALAGRYVYGDVCSGEVWSVPAGTARDPQPRKEPFTGGNLVSFGEDASGELYVLSLAGEVWRVAA